MKNIRRKRLLTFSVIIAAIFVGIFIVRFRYIDNSIIPFHSLGFYDDRLFQKGRAEQIKSTSVPYHIVVGVIPHHIVAARLLSEFFSTLSTQKPKRVILIGPDHTETAKFQVVTSSYAWTTPYGFVRPDISTIEKLHADGILSDEDAMEHEHSIGAITPYIAYYLPDSLIIPIIVSGRMRYEDILKISTVLKRYIDRDTIVIASVDFSHNLNSEEAQKRDMMTEQYIRNFSYIPLFSLNSEYLDSPASLIIAMNLAQQMQSKAMDIISHTNSGIVQNNLTMPVTSYFSINFHE